MAQHGVKSLYLTTRLQGDAGEAWDGEISMWGIRLLVDTAIPDLATGLRDLQAFLVNDAAVVSTTTHLNKQQGWTGDASGGTNVTDADQDAIAEAAWSFVDTLKSYIPNSYHVESIRLYALDDNLRAPVAPCIYVPSTTLAGTGSSALPPQVALVVSTNSATIGRKGRGRFYVGPLANGAISADGKAGSTVRSTALNGAQTLLNALRIDGTGTATAYAPVTVHRGTTTCSVINKVRVDELFDTQRRRRNRVSGTYTAADLS